MAHERLKTPSHARWGVRTRGRQALRGRRKQAVPQLQSIRRRDSRHAADGRMADQPLYAPLGHSDRGTRKQKDLV